MNTCKDGTGCYRYRTCCPQRKENSFAALMGLKVLNVGIRLPLPSPVIAILGIIGFIMGIISVLKCKDRAVFVFLSIFVGLLIIFWGAAEIIFPH